MISAEEIKQEGLKHVIPKRRGIRLRRITIQYLKQKKNNDKWLPARRPGIRQKRKMLAFAVAFGVHAVLSAHTYRVGDTLYLQIGIELTGAVARPYMLR